MLTTGGAVGLMPPPDHVIKGAKEHPHQATSEDIRLSSIDNAEATIMKHLHHNLDSVFQEDLSFTDRKHTYIVLLGKP